MEFITPIIDRTLQNVKNVKNGMEDEKGALLVSTLNRIENNSQYLAEKLTELHYPVTIDTKTDWVNTDYPYIDTEINRIKNNLELLKETYHVLNTTPSNDVSKTTMNYSDVNIMEQITFDLNYLIESMENYYVYCGVANCGQNRMFQNRFRRM